MPAPAVQFMRGANPDAAISALGPFSWIRGDYYAVSGGKVTAILDKVHPTNTFAQGTAANQVLEPTAESLVNNRPVFRFLAASTTYYTSSLAASEWKFLHDGTGCTVLTVGILRSTSTAPHVILSTGDGSTGANGRGFYFTWYHGPGPLHVLIIGTGSGRIVNDQTSVGPGNANPAHYVTRYKESEAPAEWLNTKYEGGASTGNTGNSALAPSSSDPSSTLVIGRRFDGALASANADIAEIVFFNRFLSAAEISDVALPYLYGRYGQL